MAANRRDNSPPIEGQAGAVPPPHAPRETTQPLQPGAVKAMLAKAVANEKELKPLVFEKPAPGAPAPAPQPPVKAASLKPSQAAPDLVPESPDPMPTPDPVVDPVPDPGREAPAPESLEPGTIEALSEEFRKEHPAASDSDSPSRGIPRVIQGKEITGGFGHEPSQYFALDGTEVRAVAEKLLDSLRSQMATDLRFGIACCYPQVKITATVQITGSGGSAPTNDVDHTVKADDLLTLTAFAVDDETTPADALRDQAGLKKPRKQLVTTSMGKSFADVRE